MVNYKFILLVSTVIVIDYLYLIYSKINGNSLLKVRIVWIDNPHIIYWIALGMREKRLL